MNFRDYSVILIIGVCILLRVLLLLLLLLYFLEKFCFIFTCLRLRGDVITVEDSLNFRFIFYNFFTATIFSQVNIIIYIYI
jgi:hypothetical protein